jgi:hypothetical protein
MNFLYNLYENVVLNPSPRSFFILSCAAIILYRIPFIDRLLKTFHTLIHESGHAFAALLTGGKNHRMELNTNMSGLTITESHNVFFRFIIAISGYPFASAFAYLGIILTAKNTSGTYLIILLCVLILQLILNIRNTYGIVWATGMIALMTLQLLKVPELMWATGVIISTVILFESLFKAGHILIISFTKRKMAGDAANLDKITGIHAAFWGMIFFTQALFFFVISIIEVYNISA